jgi:hypothetical protein
MSMAAFPAKMSLFFPGSAPIAWSTSSHATRVLEFDSVGWIRPGLFKSRELHGNQWSGRRRRFGWHRGQRGHDKPRWHDKRWRHGNGWRGDWRGEQWRRHDQP